MSDHSLLGAHLNNLKDLYQNIVYGGKAQRILPGVCWFHDCRLALVPFYRLTLGLCRQSKETYLTLATHLARRLRLNSLHRRLRHHYR